MTDTSSSRSIRTDKYEVPPFDTLATYKGWAAVDVSLRRHDNAVIRDYDDDLNALLILASLFATVLTAFLATSFGWLQEDFTETTADLLVQLSAQIADPTARQQIASPPSFQLVSTDVAINLLWFLSLVFTLAAALFGMIVKQWLKVYLTWQTEGPQDAIWLRQVRYKAFKEWNVGIIVAVLPGLLEVALVLFMIGIIVLLWTLHLVLALVITVVSSILLLLAFSTIIIPTFLPHCPYRSPAGWVCVVLWDSLSRAIRLPSSYSRVGGSTIKDWRDRDMVNGAYHQSSNTGDIDPEREAVKLAHLVEAAASTYEHCQNRRILEELDFAILVPLLRPGSTLRLSIPMDAVCRYFNVEADVFYAALREQYVFLHHTRTSGAVVLSLRDKFDILNPWIAPYGVTALQIFGSFLLTETISHFMHLFGMQPSRASSHCKNMNEVIEALCLVFHIIRVSPTSRLKPLFAHHLVKLYTRLAHDEALDAQFPGFRTMIVQLLRRMSFVRINGADLHVDLEYTYMSLKDHIILAISVYNSNAGYISPEDRHLFVTLSSLALAKCDSHHAHIYVHELIAQLMRCVDEVARFSLTNNVQNGGYYGDLPWMASLLASARTNPGLLNCFPETFLEVLEGSLYAGLISGEDASAQLADLKVRYALREVDVASLKEKEDTDPGMGASPASESCVSIDDLEGTDDVSSLSHLLSKTPSSDTLAEGLGSHNIRKGRGSCIWRI